MSLGWLGLSQTRAAMTGRACRRDHPFCGERAGV